MARPKKNKEKALADDCGGFDEETNTQPSPKKKELELYCKTCGGILFGGQIIHRKDCSKQ